MELFWEKPGWKEQDRHLSQLRDSPFQRKFPQIPLIPGLQVIRGPRQIGKSSLLKSLLSLALESSKKVFFLSCENIIDFKELTEILKPLKNYEAIFLDEICFVKEWSRSIKHFIDSGYRGPLIVTGSSSFDLRLGADTMPGRWAKGAGEFFLLPMLYPEWESMRQQAHWPKLEKIEGLKSFFKVGGFPMALREAGPDSNDPVQSKLEYLRWLKGDVARRGRQELFLRELMGQLSTILTTPISLQKLAQKTQMMSYHTAQDYISILEDSFALRTLFAVDRDKGSLRFKKEKKYYFTDPLLYWIAREWASLAPPDNAENVLAEMVAHEFLFRKNQAFGYLSLPKGEVDFYFHPDSAIEVKWSPVAKNLSRAYLDLNVPFKKVWTMDNFLD